MQKRFAQLVLEDGTEYLAETVIVAHKLYHAFKSASLDGAQEAPLTFAGYVEKYGKTIQGHVKPRTAERERQHLTHVLAHFGKVSLRGITAAGVTPRPTSIVFSRL